MRTRIAAAGIAMAALFTGCTTTDPTTEPTAEPSAVVEPAVSMHVPETGPAGGTAQIVIDSAGHDGETAQLYAFSTPYDEVTDCADTTVKPTPIKLTGGPQKVSVNVADEGETWFILTGKSFGTKCGAKGSSIRGLVTYQPNIDNCDGAVGCSDLSEGVAWAVNKEFTYQVSAKVKETPLVLARVSIKWVGPFETVPEANATPCQESPIALTEKGTLSAKHTGWVTAHWKRTIKESGVYRLLLTIEETEYTAGYEMSCETAPLVTVR